MWISRIRKQNINSKQYLSDSLKHNKLSQYKEGQLQVYAKGCENIIERYYLDKYDQLYYMYFDASKVAFTAV